MAEKKSFDGTLRPAEPGDLDDIMTIEDSCFGSERYDRDLMDEYLQASQITPRVSLVAAFAKAAANDNEKIAGYGLGDFANSKTGQIVSMAVGPDFRGQHLGRKLLDQVCENLRKAGAEKIVLQVETTNQVAINLYETSGFKKDHVIPNYYGRKRDAHLMVRHYADINVPKL